MHAMVILGLTFRRGKRIFWVLNDHHINFMGVSQQNQSNNQNHRFINPRYGMAHEWHIPMLCVNIPCLMKS